MDSNSFIKQIEKIAKLGSYETDLLTGEWKGSDNFIDIFGLEKKEKYKVAEFQALVHPDNFKKVMGYFAECLAQKKDFNYEYKCIKTSGEIIFVSSRSKIFYSEEGTPIRIIGIKQDITERKLTEKKTN